MKALGWDGLCRAAHRLPARKGVGGSLSDNAEPPERVFCFNHQRSKTSPIGLGIPRGPKWPAGSQEELLWAPNPPLLPHRVWLHVPSFPELLPRQLGLRDLQTLQLWGRDLSTGLLLTSWRGQEETREGLCSYELVCPGP